MLKKRIRKLNLAEDLEYFKASVFAIYKYDKKKISDSAKMDINKISVADLTTNFSKKEFLEWEKVNAFMGVSNYVGYLLKITELQKKEKENTYEKYLHSLKPNERKIQKRFFWYWVKFTEHLFGCITNASTINLLYKHHELAHFKDKANKIINDNPVIWNLKEEIRFDLSEFFRQRLLQIKGKKGIGFSGASAAPLQSGIQPQQWIDMIKDLSHGKYLANFYSQDEDQIRTWIANALKFSNKKETVVLNNYFEKLKWEGSAMALAKWTMKLKFVNAFLKTGNNHFMLTWIENFIEYPGTRKALIVALSNWSKYDTEFFEIKKSKSLGFSFTVLLPSRASKK